MEINKKLLFTVLSQIKAHKKVVVFRDSLKKGFIEILYCPEWKNSTVPHCVNKISFHIDGSETNLFENPSVEKIGKPVLLYVNRIKDALKKAQGCFFIDGCINGIKVEVDKSEIQVYSLLNYIVTTYKRYEKVIKGNIILNEVTFEKTDYSYMVFECSKFSGVDPAREYMDGICIDFYEGGKDYVYIIANDGRKQILLKHKYSHRVCANKDDGQFKIRYDYLFTPGSNYDSVRFEFKDKYCQIFISTIDYTFESILVCSDYQYPNYIRVIPNEAERNHWVTISTASIKSLVNSIKDLIKEKDTLYLNAEDPENLKLNIEGSQSFDIDGKASRPMILSFAWKHISPCLFDKLPYTKFFLNSSNESFITHENKPDKGISFDIIKIFMPIKDKFYLSADYDEYRIPK